MHGFWPDVLTKSKGKIAFNEATASNIDIPKDELLLHFVRCLSPMLASGYDVVKH